MEILLIGEDGKKIGNMSIETARKMAQDCEKDLILIDARNSVYKIIDEGKLKYEQRQKEKKQRSSRRIYKIKEIRLRYSTDTHDLEIKSRQAKEFLKNGLRTKISLRFKGRELSFKSMGMEKFNSFISLIISDGYAVVDKPPVLDGNTIVAFLKPVTIQNIKS